MSCSDLRCRLPLGVTHGRRDTCPIEPFFGMAPDNQQSLALVVSPEIVSFLPRLEIYPSASLASVARHSAAEIHCQSFFAAFSLGRARVERGGRNGKGYWAVSI